MRNTVAGVDFRFGTVCGALQKVCMYAGRGLCVYMKGGEEDRQRIGLEG